MSANRNSQSQKQQMEEDQDQDFMEGWEFCEPCLDSEEKEELALEPAAAQNENTNQNNSQCPDLSQTVTGESSAKVVEELASAIQDFTVVDSGDDALQSEKLVRGESGENVERAETLSQKQGAGDEAAAEKLAQAEAEENLKAKVEGQMVQTVDGQETTAENKEGDAENVATEAVASANIDSLQAGPVSEKADERSDESKTDGGNPAVLGRGAEGYTGSAFGEGAEAYTDPAKEMAIAEVMDLLANTWGAEGLMQAALNILEQAQHKESSIIQAVNILVRAFGAADLETAALQLIQRVQESEDCLRQLPEENWDQSPTDSGYLQIDSGYSDQQKFKNADPSSVKAASEGVSAIPGFKVDVQIVENAVKVLKDRGTLDHENVNESSRSTPVSGGEVKVRTDEEDWGEDAATLQMIRTLETSHPMKDDNLLPGIMVVGGFAITEDRSVRHSCHAYRLRYEQNLQTSFWPQNLPEGIYSGEYFATCVCKNELYFCGGNESGQAFASYDPIINRWKILPSMPVGLRNHTVSSVDGKIFLIGGMDAMTKVIQDTIYCFDTKTFTWSKLECCLSPAMEHISSAVCGKSIYIFGNSLQSNDCLIQSLDVNGDAYEIRSGFQPLPFQSYEIWVMSRNKNLVYVADQMSGSVTNVWLTKDQVLLRRLKGTVTDIHQVKDMILVDDELITFGQGGQKERIGDLTVRLCKFPMPVGCQVQALNIFRTHFISPSAGPGQQGAGVSLLQLMTYPGPSNWKGNRQDPPLQWGDEGLSKLERDELELAIKLSMEDFKQQQGSEQEEELGAVGGVDPNEDPLHCSGKNYSALAALLAGSDDMARIALQVASDGEQPTEEVWGYYKEQVEQVEKMSEEEQIKLATLLSLQEPSPPRHEEEEVFDSLYPYDNNDDDDDDYDDDDDDKDYDEGEEDGYVGKRVDGPQEKERTQKK